MLGVVVAVLAALVLLGLAGLVQGGYMKGVWRRTSRMASGRRYDGD